LGGAPILFDGENLRCYIAVPNGEAQRNEKVLPMSAKKSGDFVRKSLYTSGIRLQAALHGLNSLFLAFGNKPQLCMAFENEKKRKR
jgi:hypothetical protein